MKILLIHNKYQQPGGEDVVFKSESDLLSQHGHTVEHMVYDNSIIKTFLDKCLSGIRTIYNPESARAIQQKIEHFGPHLIHIHNFVPLVSPSVLFVANKNNIPVVITLHNYRLLCPSATLFHSNKLYEKSIHSIFPWDAVIKGVYRNSIIQTAAVALMTAWHNIIGTWRNKVDLYITLTQFAKEKFKNSALSIPGEKMTVKPNFVMNMGRGAATRENFFLFVGRLTDEKGIQTLLNATKLHDFKLVIIGDGPLRYLVEDFARTNANLHYLGFQNKDTVLHHLKTCKALIFPSIWYEGFPMTILEAFSTGTLVLASKLGGMAEIIQHRVNGMHFEGGNAQDMVAKIIEILEQPEWVKYMSDNARLTYLEQYTPEKNYTMLTGIYDLAIANKLLTRERLTIDRIPTIRYSSIL